MFFAFYLEPESTFGSYKIIVPNDFFEKDRFVSVINELEREKFEDIVNKTFPLFAEKPTFALVQKLKLVNSEISERITTLELRNDVLNELKIDVPLKQSVSNGEVPLFNQNSKKRSGPTVREIETLYHLESIVNLAIATTAFSLADIELQKSSLKSATENVEKGLTNDEGTVLKAVLYIEAGFFQNSNETNDQALCSYCKALRTLLLGSCEQQHSHSSKCVSSSVPWHVVFVAYYGILKTFEFIGLKEAGKDTKASMELFTSAFHALMTPDGASFDTEKNRECFRDLEEIQTQKEIVSTIKDACACSKRIAQALSAEVKKSKQDGSVFLSLATFEQFICDEIDALEARFVSPQRLVCEFEEDWDDDDFEDAAPAEKLQLASNSTEPREFPDDERDDGSLGEDDDWDVEMNIQSDVKEGAFASLIFHDAVAAKNEEGVPAKAKLLEACQVDKDLHIVKYPPASQLFTLKADSQDVFHEDQLEEFLTCIVKKRFLEPPNRFISKSANAAAGEASVMERDGLFFSNLYADFPYDSVASSGVRDIREDVDPAIVDLVYQLNTIESMTLNQFDAVWPYTVNLFATLRRPADPENAELLDTLIVELISTIARMWCIKKQLRWQRLLKISRRCSAEQAPRISLIEQETYCHCIMDSDDTVFDEWADRGFEPDPVKYFCDVALSTSTGTSSEVILKASALSDVILFLFSLSPLTCEEKVGSDDPFELIKGCCDDQTILNPKARYDELLKLYRQIGCSTVKAKVAFVLSLQSIQSGNWADAESQLFESLYIIDKLKSVGTNHQIVSDLGAAVLKKYGDVLIHNGKYRYGILCFEAACLTYELMHKKESFSLMMKTANLAIAHDDTERAIATELSILDKYNRENRKHEASFITQTLALLYLDSGNFKEAVNVLSSSLLYTYSLCEELGSQKLVLEAQLAMVHMKSYFIDDSLKLLEKYKIQDIPKHKRAVLLTALGKVYLRKGWVADFRGIVRMLQEQELDESELCGTSSVGRDIITESWKMAVKCYLSSNDYVRAFIAVEVILRLVPENSIAIKGKYELLRCRALRGLWKHSESQHYPICLQRSAVEPDEIISQLLSHLDAKCADATIGSTFASSADLFFEVVDNYDKVISLFSSTGRERKEVLVSQELATFFLDYIFPLAAILKYPIGQILSFKQSSSALFSGTESDSGNDNDSDSSDNSVSLTVISHYLSTSIDYASSTIDVELLLEALLSFAELRYLEDKKQFALDFWKQWRDIFFKLFISDARAIGQKNPLYHFKFLLKNLERGVRLLFVFERSVISQNLFVIDTFLNVERASDSALKRSFVPFTGTDRPAPESSARSIDRLKDLFRMNPQDPYAEEIWDNMHAINIQLKKHDSGSLSLEKLQTRNRSSFRAILNAANQARQQNGSKDLAQLYDAAKTIFAEKSATFVYVIQLHEMVIYYSPSTEKMKVDRLSSLKTSGSLTKAETNGSIVVQLATVRNTSCSVTLQCPSSLTIEQLLAAVCDIYAEDTASKVDKKSHYYYKKMDIKILEVNPSFHSELRQLKAKLCPDAGVVEEALAPLNLQREVKESWSSSLALTKQKSSFQPLPSALPLNQCLAAKELKSNSRSKPLSLLLVGRAVDDSTESSNVLTLSDSFQQYIRTIYSGKQPFEMFRDEKKDADEARREMAGLFTSLGFVLEQTFAADATEKAKGAEGTEAPSTNVCMFCNHDLQIIPWELLLRNIIRYTSFYAIIKNRELGYKGDFNLELSACSFASFVFNDPGYLDTDLRTYDEFVIKSTLAKLSMQEYPVISRVISMKSGEPYFSPLVSLCTQKWKKRLKKAKVASDLKDKDDEIIPLELDQLVSLYTEAIPTKKTFVIATCFDLLDYGDFILYIARELPQYSIVFVPSYKITAVAERLKKMADVQAKGGRGKETAKQTLLSAVNEIIQTKGIPIILYN